MDNAKRNDFKRLSCRYLDGGLVFHGNAIQACCVTHHGDRGHTILLEPWTGGLLPVNDILEARNRVVEQLQRPEGYKSCNGCTLLRESPPEKRRYAFDYLDIAHYFRCNLHCSYCSNYHRRLMNRVEVRELLPTLKALLQGGFLNPGGHADWAGGEPTLNPEFPEISAFLDQTGMTQTLHTNAVVFSEAVLRIVPSSLQRMYVSVDAGTRETYQRIKGLDAFDRVWQNLARYTRVGGRRIIAKMILLRENLNEVTEFVRHAEKAGIQTVIADLDQLESNVSDDQVEAGAIMMEECARRGIRMVAGWNTLHARPEKGYTARVHRRYQERLKDRGFFDRVLQRIGTARALRHAVRIPRSLCNRTGKLSVNADTSPGHSRSDKVDR